MAASWHPPLRQRKESPQRSGTPPWQSLPERKSRQAGPRQSTTAATKPGLGPSVMSPSPAYCLESPTSTKQSRSLSKAQCDTLYQRFIRATRFWFCASKPSGGKPCFSLRSRRSKPQSRASSMALHRSVGARHSATCPARRDPSTSADLPCRRMPILEDAAESLELPPPRSSLPPVLKTSISGPSRTPSCSTVTSGRPGDRRGPGRYPRRPVRPADAPGSRLRPC